MKKAKKKAMATMPTFHADTQEWYQWGRSKGFVLSKQPK